MGAHMSITAIVDLAILAHSITVQVNLKGTGGWQSPIHCAAFRGTNAGSDEFNWGNEVTVSRYPGSEGAHGWRMPEITRDNNGNPITAETNYVVKCGFDPHHAKKKYLSTRVRTPVAPTPAPTPVPTPAPTPSPTLPPMATPVATPVNPPMEPPVAPVCVTGVRLNGNEAAQIDMDGQETLTLGATTWSHFPETMDGMHAYTLPYPVPASSNIELTCCAGEECVFFFSLYNCVACTGPKPAGLAETLILDGWDTGACSPRFGSGDFKTTAFHKSLDAVDADVVISYTAQHDEVMALFGLEGSVQEPWCVKPHGPVFGGGAGCGGNCPVF